MAKDSTKGNDSSSSGTQPVEPQPVGQPYPAPTQPDTNDSNR